MSLDVASTTLDTAWAEFSTISYTAGTIADLSTCIDEVEAKLNRGTLTSETRPTVDNVANWLSRAKQELAETRQFTWRRRFVTGVLSSDNYRYSLPPDYGGGYISIRDVTNDNRLHMINQNTFDAQFPDMSSEQNGDMAVFTIRGIELNVAPAPRGTPTIELEYERTGDDIDSADFSWLPEIERFRCCDFAVSEAFSSIHQWQEADRYTAKWNYGMQKASKADGRRRWSQQGFRIRSILGG